MCIFLPIVRFVAMCKLARGHGLVPAVLLIPGVKIGKWSIIGAGSVVTKDIPDGVLAVGNRCKIIKNIVL